MKKTKIDHTANRAAADATVEALEKEQSRFNEKITELNSELRDLVNTSAPYADIASTSAVRNVFVELRDATSKILVEARMGRDAAHEAAKRL